MKLIIAQGNPEPTYTGTRHNVGFLAVNAMAARQDVAFVAKPKFFAHLAEYTDNGQKIVLVKPTTYYNETGKTARALVDFYKLDPRQSVLVIHDDMALPFGTVRVRDKGSDAGNNGIKSLNAHLGNDYMRLRVGISNELRSRMGDDASFVLATFARTEQASLQATIIPQTLQLIDDFCRDQLAVTSHRTLQP